jgi:hypothetical protein
MRVIHPQDSCRSPLLSLPGPQSYNSGTSNSSVQHSGPSSLRSHLQAHSLCSEPPGFKGMRGTVHTCFLAGQQRAMLGTGCPEAQPGKRPGLAEGLRQQQLEVAEAEEACGFL